MWRTHILFGINSLWLIDPLIHTSSSTNIGVLAAIAAYGALLPDLDAAESKIKSISVSGIRPFAPISSLIYNSWGHRGPLHSWLGLGFTGIVALAVSFWWGWEASMAIFLGYVSHLAADACTKTGIPFFYPNMRRYFLLPPRLRITTGSGAEEILFPFLAIAALLLLLLNFPHF